MPGVRRWRTAIRGLQLVLALLLAACADAPRPEPIASNYHPDAARIHSSIETDVSLQDRLIDRRKDLRLVALLQAAHVLDAAGKPLAHAPGATDCEPGAHGYCAFLIARVRIEGVRAVWQLKPQLDNGGHRVVFVRILATPINALGARLATSGLLSCLDEFGAVVPWRGAQTVAYTAYVTDYDGGSATGGSDCPVTKSDGNLESSSSFLQTGRNFSPTNGYEAVR